MKGRIQYGLQKEKKRDAEIRRAEKRMPEACVSLKYSQNFSLFEEQTPTLHTMEFDEMDQFVEKIWTYNIDEEVWRNRLEIVVKL